MSKDLIIKMIFMNPEGKNIDTGGVPGNPSETMDESKREDREAEVADMVEINTLPTIIAEARKKDSAGTFTAFLDKAEAAHDDMKMGKINSDDRGNRAQMINVLHYVKVIAAGEIDGDTTRHTNALITRMDDWREKHSN